MPRCLWWLTRCYRLVRYSQSNWASCKSGCVTGSPGHAGTAADVDARSWCARRADLCRGDRRSRTVQNLQGCWRTFRTDAKEISIGRDRRHRSDFQDRRCRRAHRALRGSQRHPDPAGQGFVAEELGDARGQACWHAQGKGSARPEARRGPAPDAGRRDRVRRRQGGCQGIDKGEITSSGGQTPAARSRSRRRDDGSGQTARAGAARKMTARPLDWPTDPHQTPSGGGLAPTPDRSKTPATGSRSKGLTQEGPLQKPLLFTA